MRKSHYQILMIFVLSILMISLQCTEGKPLVYSWYPSSVLNTPSVLMITLHIHHGEPQCTHGIPQCNEHPPVYSRYPLVNRTPPDVLMVSPTIPTISPWCTEHPRCTHGIPTVLIISPNVLNIPCVLHPPPPAPSVYYPNIMQDGN